MESPLVDPVAEHIPKLHYSRSNQLMAPPVAFKPDAQAQAALQSPSCERNAVLNSGRVMIRPVSST